jgi:hypothetical protein
MHSEISQLPILFFLQRLIGQKIESSAQRILFQFCVPFFPILLLQPAPQAQLVSARKRLDLRLDCFNGSHAAHPEASVP